MSNSQNCTLNEPLNVAKVVVFYDTLPIFQQKQPFGTKIVTEKNFLFFFKPESLP